MAQLGTPAASPCHCHTRPGSTEGGRCSPDVVIVEAMFRLDHVCAADKQAAGKCHTEGNSLLKLLSDCERVERRTLHCMPCVNILCGTVEWSRVMQVKYKLQAVVK